MNAAYGNPKPYFDLRSRSIARWREITDELPQLPIHWGGSLSWDMAPEELQDYVDQHGAWGYDIERVDADEIGQLEPHLSASTYPDWGWGVHAGGEGALEAHLAAELFVAEAVANWGATFVADTVTGFLGGGNGTAVGGVRTEGGGGGAIHADHVVLAAGLGSVELMATLGIELPLHGVEGLLVNSFPITGGPAVDERLLNSVVYTEDIHLRQTVNDGRIRAGTDFSGGAPGDDPQKTAEEVFAVVKSSLEAEGVEGLELDYYTVGVRPTPEDDLPILGETGVDGLTVAVMHSGVSNAAIVGDLLSKLILTGESDPALDHFRLDRFD